MATIKAIEAKSVHQIQSGQVIVDLCSVVKELVENSLDAGATSIEVRFKNYGLDSIEVSDNGPGISPDNYETVALKHYTSKLANYDDLADLNTFGFRGEALSSLCALSSFSITTAQAQEAPKGTRLEFASSGTLKSTSTVAATKGTIVTVENLFEGLPVRRKELAKNIKREYGKVIGLLHAYACIGTQVKLTVKNAMPKGNSMVVFSTKGNATTRENIANVYGSKTLSALAPLNLKLEFDNSMTQVSRDGPQTRDIIVQGHISKPIFGEGRQTPDRQLFFVNGRPCGLPQIAKAINEVYRSFNISQSPFVFADFRMDTNAYDVNVSPDKRTILLHDATNLTDRLRACLTEMFENTVQTVPQSQLQTPKLPAFRQLAIQRPPKTNADTGIEARSTTPLRDTDSAEHEGDSEAEPAANRHFHDQFRNITSTREDDVEDSCEHNGSKLQKAKAKRAEKIAEALARQEALSAGVDEFDDVYELADQQSGKPASEENANIVIRNFNAHIAAQQQKQRPATSTVTFEDRDRRSSADEAESDAEPRRTIMEASSGVVQNAFDRMRPKRSLAQIATITVDDETTTQIIGTKLPLINSGSANHSGNTKIRGHGKETAQSLSGKFSQSLRRFGATQPQDSISEGDGDDEEHEDLDPQQPDSPNESVGSSGMEGEPEGGSGADQHDNNHDRNQLEIEEELEAENEDSAESQQPEQETGSEPDSDPDYLDEAEKKAQEEARVAELIRLAEQDDAKISTQRVNKALKPGTTKESTVSLLSTLDISLEDVQRKAELWRAAVRTKHSSDELPDDDAVAESHDAESQLSLTVSKDDFSRMRIVGQFNLGFILAVRPVSTEEDSGHTKDELFIIDQHASDEKYNFEQLQAGTTVGNQRMVRPVTLSLTAVEEEIVLDNSMALEKNGFIVEIDVTGAAPVGRRCKLTSLPLSKEVVFDTRDLDELIHLLSEAPVGADESSIPRPTRVRKMFAMRACRSSIMIGKTLSQTQMRSVIDHMGTIDKPWNCPHGRPTMRHLSSLSGWETWEEGDDMLEGHITEGATSGSHTNTWQAYISEQRD